MFDATALSWSLLNMDQQFPFRAAIGDDIASLRDVPGRPSEGSSLGPGRKLKLLRKLSDLGSPERQVIARRGERVPMALTVEVAVGLPQILRAIRNKPEVAVAPETRASRRASARSVRMCPG